MALRTGLLECWPLTSNSVAGTESSGLTLVNSGAAYVSGSPGPCWQYGTSSQLKADSVSLTYPFALAVWWKSAGSLPSGGTLASWTLADGHYFQLLAPTSGFGIMARARQSGTFADANDTGNASSSAWNLSVAIFDSPTSTRCWTNGAFGSTVTTSCTPAGSYNRLGFGVIRRDTDGGFIDGVYTKLGAVWNGAVPTDADLDAWFADPTAILPVVAPVITGPSGAAGAGSSTANLAELATTGPTFTTSTTLGGGYPTLTGADAASFTITTLSSTSFRVDPVTPFNFESLPHSNPFNVTFNASASVSQTCAITVTNVNEAPTFSGTISVPTLTEGVAMSAINAALLFSDPDSGDTGTYSAVGTLPTGVTVSSAGLISGTPGAGTAATYSGLRVRRTDGGGLTADSNVFSFSVSAAGAPPGVTAQPSNQTVTEGGVATFTAAFSNSPTGYAWEFADAPYSSWSPVVGGSGAATATYITGALLLANSGRRFRCTGTNAFGSTTTNGTAQVTVNPAPAYSALTDIIAESGIPKVGTTVYWTWFPSGRPGAAASPVQGSSVTNGSGRALITHSVPGDGMVLLGTRPGPLVSDDRVWLDFLTLA